MISLVMNGATFATENVFSRSTRSGLVVPLRKTANG